MKAVTRQRARIAPWRKLVQWISTLLLLLVPFLRVGGDSLLRLDAPTRTLLFFGAKIRIEEFYLFLIVVLILVFGFLFVTMLFGRVWCGWLCPQTTLCDLSEWIDGQLHRLIRLHWLALAVRQLAYLAIAALVACNLVWYFIAPHDFWARVRSGEIGAVAGITLTSTFLLVYLDLALVRRKFCKTICPYGRIQLMTMDRGTLTLEFDQSLQDACLRCGACVRACPMEIDIRDGLQIECINCGRCLDACREVRERTGGKGLIRYTFGSGEEAGGLRLTARVVVVALIIALLTTVLVLGVKSRQEATLKVQRAPKAQVKRLPDGSLVNFYIVYVENRGGAAGAFSIEVAPAPGYRVELVGPVRDIELAPNENREVNVALKLFPAPRQEQELQVRLLQRRKVVAAAKLPVVPQ